MTDDKTFYRWVKFKNGVGSVAIVILNVFRNVSNKNEIVECYSGNGFTSQGHIEDVPAIGLSFSIKSVQYVLQACSGKFTPLFLFLLLTPV